MTAAMYAIDQKTEDTAMRVVSFKIFGIPQPKGSMVAYVPRKWAALAAASGTRPQAVVQTDNRNLKQWQHLVSQEARAASNGKVFKGPVHVGLRFQLPRPASWPGKLVHPFRKPDIDKLARAVLDGLTHTLLEDDARVVELDASKVFADEVESPGVIVTVYEVSDHA